MQKKKRNSGFTMVELLVVVAVLAVLATVSIVGYTTFVEKAKISVDVQTLEQLNLVLMANEQSGNGAQNVKDAYNQIYQAGLMPMFTPQGNNLGVCWDSQTNRFVLFQSGANANQGKVVHSTDSKVSNGVDVDVNNDNRFFVYNEPALCQHQWDDRQIVQQPTCTEQGLKTETCKICQTTQNQQVDATGHNWDNGTTTTPPTCQSNGTKTFCCTQCGVTDTEAIAPTGHIEVIDSAVEATCTQTGLTEGKHCSICGEVIVAQQIVDIKAHTEETVSSIAPTCTQTGLTAGTKCSVCGVTLVAQTVLDALGHTEVIDSAVDATCTETGLTEGKHCSVCNEVIVPQTIVDKIAHTEQTIPAVDATCTTTGLTAGTKCSVCGDTLVAQEVVGTIDHNIVGGKCSHCGYQVVTTTFSVYSADAITVENGSYTTNYSSENLQAETDSLLDTMLNAGTIVIKLGKDLTLLNFSTYFWNGETNNSTIYIDLNGCNVSGTITLSARNFTLYIFDSSATKGKVGSVNVGTSGQLFVWDVEISNSNNVSGITSSGVNVTMYSGSIHGCDVIENGGAINCSNANVSIYDGKIYQNFAKNGAGIYVSNGVATIHNGEIYNNYASGGNGGAVYVAGTQNTDSFVMNGGYIYGNSATNGGGISAKGNVTINGGTISGNSAAIGGGIHNHHGTVTINGGTIGGANPYTQTGDAKTMANKATSNGSEILSENIVTFNNGTMYLQNYGGPFSIVCYNDFHYIGGSFVCEQNYMNYVSFY